MKYTETQKEEVFAFFEDGCTAREIFEVTGIPIGTINRGCSERRSSNKSPDEDLRTNLQTKIFEESVKIFEEELRH